MRKLVLLFICLVMATPAAFAVNDDKDWQVWTGYAFSYDVNDDWQLGAEEELRYGDEVSDLYYEHTEASLAYKGLAKWLQIGAGYRLCYDEKGRDFQYENQPFFLAKTSWNVKGWGISDNTRFEYRDKEKGNDLWRLRSKLIVAAPWKFTKYAIRPFAADELYFDCDEEDFNQNRIYGGLMFKIVEHVGGEVYYMLQRADKGDWIDYNVIGTKLKFSF